MDLTVALTIIAIFIGSAVLFARRRASKNRNPLSQIPRIPFLKTLPLLISGNIPYDELYNGVRSSLSLSDRKVYVVRMPWGQPAISGTSPVLIKEFFDTNKFIKFDVTYGRKSFYSTLMGRNISAVNGDEWLLHRSVTRPAFSRPLKMDVFIMETQKAMKILQNHTKRSTESSAKRAIDVYRMMQRFTLSVLGFGIFSYDFQSLPTLEVIDKFEDFSTAPAGPYVDMYNHIIKHIMSPKYFAFPFLLYTPLPSIRETWNKVNAFSDLLRGMVEKRKESVAAIKAEGKSLDPQSMDLLDMMIEAAFEEDAATKWTTENMMHNLFAFFVAGHDTTSTALSCALFQLATHPDIQNRARDEVKEIFGAPNSFDEAIFLGNQVPITHSQLSRLQLINAVIKESMRLHPSVAQLIRVAATDVNVRIPLGKQSGGVVREFTIPKGTIAAVDIWGAHHDPENFENPEEFKPERWLNNAKMNADEPDTRLPSWAPFGGGSRICMGMQFSLVEQRVFLLTVLRAFDISVSEKDKGKKLALGGGGLLHPVAALELVFNPRWPVA
ncbi:cytochrome P450 [Cladochytrium replicatum]|nr:cytochrome P450 [Cladochytrium replicatum]